uniref:Semaphorin-6A n=1 Tax=Anolis carolinensis TaxID=28377 RepID=A0A803TAC3_ANOCA|nr:PREDICTED: semaphorin-6A isoform X1 [Anolis carolinensis]XP_008112246.1 PREDICTED: semaphorin-6A isoform X1 [Anolis carolinensis]|eukprot:XP_008112245.1 PREDICTED: semaphorin-6A isoform X1 [Anolis carolinensis]
MRSEALLLYFTLLHFAGADFPEDPEPISISHGNYTKQYPVFVGHKPGHNTPQRHKLDIQLLMIMERTLYIAARDHIYTVDIDTSHTEEIYFSKKLTWKSRQLDVDTCRMKGKHKDECHNFIKVFLKRSDDTLFICGTNAFSPSCRNYKMDTLEFMGEEFSGMARCPYDAKHANVALFAEGKLYSATVTDFLAIDAVIYRSLGDSPTLRTVKHDSKWLKEPYFVHAVDYGNYIYFFFREIAVEYHSMGKVIFPRVARVCKNDMGGSQRVLEKQWTSFLKARLNCSVPGDSHFYFNILQAVTDVVHINGRNIVLATFSTPYNSIPGSAVCAYDILDIANVFTGRFKEQKSPDSIWTPVPDERVPKPRPGSCAGSTLLEKYTSSNEFPDDTLNFIKTHSLMDEAVPSIVNKPWFLRTMVRYRLTKIAVDNAAGPNQNHTVVFLGSEKGIILKFLVRTGTSGFLNDSLFLEEMSIYNSEKCSYDGVEDKRIVGMQLDKQSSALYVAFSNCLIRVPLGRCERHSKCKKACIASRDPYCGWIKESGACMQLLPGTKLAFEQDVEHGNTEGLGDCQNSFVALNDISTTSSDHEMSYTTVYGHTSSLFPSATTSDSPAQQGYDPRGRMLDWKDPVGSSENTNPYVAVSSHNHQDKKGVIRESYLKGHDQLVPVTLLAIAVILAFVMGAVFSGIIVYCICDHRRRDVTIVQRKEKELVQSRRGSMSSVTKLSGLFGDTQSKEPKPDAILTPLMHNGKLATPGTTAKMLIKADQHHLDLAALPTPESTPTLQQKRKPSRGSRDWERNQNLINACTKDIPPMASPVIPTDLPLRASPSHIPSVVVLPVSQQGYQHEYVDQPKMSDMAQMAMEDQNATLEYKTIKEHLSSKSPNHGVNLVENLESMPPKVPQREASLGPPGSSLAQSGLGKRLEMHSSAYNVDYKRNYPTNSLTRNHQTSTLKRNNTNSSNSSHLSRNQSFGRGENPPPAPQRVDSIQVHAAQGQTVTVSRQPSLTTYNSLTRSGLKRTPSLKPDVPPKPFSPLSSSMKPNDTCT